MENETNMQSITVGHDVTMERNSGSTMIMMTQRMTTYFQLIEIDKNQCGNVNGWSACLAVWQPPPSRY